MAKSVKQMLAEADAAVPRITPAQAKDLIAKGALVVDVRDALELRSAGKVAGALHIPRGLLEFQADPESPAHNKALDKAKAVIVYCASGGRSALAGKTLKDMGYTEVYNGGGFKDLAQGGAPIEKV
jgi:rhodanese-related sulfurtransferase